MAPALLGRHYQMSCAECKFGFACDGVNIPADRQTVCPNCGFSENELQPAQFVAADRVAILPSDQLERWDVVAVALENREGNAAQFAVKRIVGLPGEEFCFEHGDILVDGVVAVKPLAVQKALRIPVFDSDCRTSRDASLAGRMIRVPNVSRLDGGSEDTIPIVGTSGRMASTMVDVEHKVRFQPIVGYRSKEAGEPVNVIKDFYAYNQKLSRKLNRVDQLYMQFDILAAPEVGVMIQVPGPQSVKIYLNLESVDVEQMVGEEIKHRSFEMPLRTEVGLKIEISSFDRQLCLLVNDLEIFNIESLDQEPLDKERAWESLELSVADGTCRLNRLQVWRDIYYFDQGKEHFSKLARRRTGESEYFVLGDNVPVSIDSRWWSEPAVDRRQIIGVVSQSP